MTDTVLSYFPQELKNVIGQVKESYDEIRLRCGRPLSFFGKNGIFYTDINGRVVNDTVNAVIVSDNELERTFEAICRYSVHSYQNEIVNGFITLESGHRVGICGSAVIHNGIITNVKAISSLNFRIARQVKGCAEQLFNTVYSSGLKNLILAGPPSSGKTTMLRDLCRMLSKRYKTALIDERCEIAAVYGSRPSNDVGDNTDIFSGYTKPAGIEAAIRVMSPQIILCDEAGSDEDFAAFENAVHCGVKLAVTIHASSYAEIKDRFKEMLRGFEYAVILSHGRIAETVRIDAYAENCGSGCCSDSVGTGRKLFCVTACGTAESAEITQPYAVRN